MPEKSPGAKEDKEQWKPIPEFEGLYEVSTCGRSAMKKYRTCIGIWPDGTERSFESCTIAARETGIPQGNVWGACNGLWKHAGGVEWKYADQHS